VDVRWRLYACRGPTSQAARSSRAPQSQRSPLTRASASSLALSTPRRTHRVAITALALVSSYTLCTTPSRLQSVTSSAVNPSNPSSAPRSQPSHGRVTLPFLPSRYLAGVRSRDGSLWPAQHHAPPLFLALVPSSLSPVDALVMTLPQMPTKPDRNTAAHCHAMAADEVLMRPCYSTPSRSSLVASLGLPRLRELTHPSAGHLAVGARRCTTVCHHRATAAMAEEARIG
jgi:hypothetical protein